MKIGKIADKVKAILILHEDARIDDRTLYYYFLKIYYPEMLGTTVGAFLRVGDVRIPSIESIGRARRKIQELCPELRATKKVKEARAEQQGVYRDFELNYKG